MRQFVFGLVLAGLAAWGFVSWSGGGAYEGGKVDLGAVKVPGATAVPESGSVGQADPGAASAKPTATPAAASVPQQPAPSAETRSIEQAFQALARRVAAGEAAAREELQRLLARTDLPAELRDRLRQLHESGEAKPATSQASAPAVPSTPGGGKDKPEDLPNLLERLGTNNAFVQTAEGRAVAQRALQLLAALGDEAAIPLHSALLERCMRGPIAKGDASAREFIDQAYAQYRVRADRFLCDPANLAKCRSMTVGKGDSLQAIAARFRKEGISVDDGTLAILNRIHNPNAVQVGQRIKAPVDPIRAVLEKRSFLLGIYVGDVLLRLYWVGHGENDKTPVTEFTVGEKIANPPWYAPDGKVYPYGDPKNILGNYFLKLSNPSYSGFGIHGTPYPETIGTMSSMGCIRMYDKDIEELYRLLPRKAKVEVRDSN